MPHVTPDEFSAPAEVATPQEVLSTFTQIMRGDMLETVVRKSGGGEELIQLPPKIAERSKAAEMLGKGFGLFSEQEPEAPAKEDVARQLERALAKGRRRRE